MTRTPGQLLVVCVERRSLPISEPVDTSCLRRYHARSVLPRNDTVAAASRARLKFGLGHSRLTWAALAHVFGLPPAATSEIGSFVPRTDVTPHRRVAATMVLRSTSSSRGSCKRLHQRPRGERFCEIGEATGLMCGQTNGRAVVPSHVDDRHRIVPCFEAVPQLDAQSIAQIDVEKDTNRAPEVAVLAKACADWKSKEA